MTGRLRRFAAGLSIEGIGLDSTHTDPWVFCDQAYKANEANANATSYRWTSGATGGISASGYSVNPFQGDINTSSLDLRLHNTDELGERFRYQDTSPTVSVASDIDSSDTSLDLSDTSLADSVVYINDETILLGSHSGGGTYTGCTRGIWGSPAQDHDAGNFVYTTGAPHWLGRRVEFIVHNLETAEERSVWPGYIRDIQTDGEGTVIGLSLGELVGAGKNTEINVGAESLDHDLEVRVAANGRKYVTGSLVPRDADSNVYITTVRETSEWASSGRYTWIQCDGALVLCRENTPVDFYPDLRLGSEVETDIDDGQLSAALEEDVYELFVVCPAADALVQEEYSSTDWASSTGGLRNLDGFYDFGEETAVQHPWSIALALINSGSQGADDLSVWEELKDLWGAGLGWAVQEGSPSMVRTIRQLIEAFPHLRVDQLVLGWDGQPVNPWKVALYQLFLPFGLIPGVTKNGLPTFRRFGLMDIEQFNDALGNELTPILGKAQHKQAHGSTADRIVANVGELPWRKGDRIEDRISGNSRRASSIADQQKFELDYSVVAPENYESIAGNTLSLSRLAHYAMPRWVLRFNDWDIDDLDYTVSEYVSLSKWPVQGSKPIDPETQEATLDVQGKAWACGLIIGRRPSFDDHSYELEILLTAYNVGQPARWRGPALVATSYTQLSTTTKIYTDNLSNFGFGDSDNEAFFVGDEVQGVNEDGTAGSFLNEEIVDISSDGTGEYIEVDGLITTAADEIIRLVPFGSYSNNGALANVDRVWSFLADGSGELGSPAEAGDVYGTLWGAPSRLLDYTGNWDGAEFRSVDNDAVSADEPADTYVDHALRNNEFYLYHYAARFNVEFWASSNATEIATDPSERLVTSREPATIAMGRFPVLRGLETITSYWHAGVCDTAFDGNGEVEITMQLVTGVGVVRTASKVISDTTADTVEIQEHEVTLDVSDVPTSLNARLLFKARGLKADANRGTFSASLVWPDRVDLGTEDEYDQGGILTDENGQPFAEVINDDISVNNAPKFHPAGTLPGTVDLYAMGALALRGISVETTYRGGGEGFVEYAQEEIAARQAVGGSVAQRHQRNATHLKERPIVRAFGALGDDETFTGTKKQYMPYVEFAATKTSYTLGQPRTIPVAHDPCRLDVTLDVLGIQEGAWTPDGGEAAQWLRRNAASGSVTITVTVTELASGGNTTHTESKSFEWDFFPAIRSGDFLALHAWTDEDSTAYRIDHLNDNDLGLLQRGIVPISLSDIDESRPLKLEVEATLSSFDKVQRNEASTSGFNDPSDLRIQLCGFSVVENG
jgi:hypothetical protein